MGSDDLFKKREDRKKRQHEFKTAKANSFLIVTEGERTEPLYFRGIRKLIIEKIGCICIFTIVILHFIEMIGVKN